MTRFVNRYAATISRQLLTKRWWIMLAIAILVVVVEYNEHKPDLAGLLDPNFLREILIFGVLLPVSWGLMLTLLAHTEGERIKAEQSLDQQQALGQQLNDAAQWDELIEKIVKFPRSIVPVTSTFLHIYNPDYDRYEMAADWLLDSNLRRSMQPILTDETCHSCLKNSTENGIAFNPCTHADKDEKSPRATLYCLPLIHGQQLVALLHMDFPTDITITSSQIRVLSSVSHEMALAIEGARLQRSVQRQAEETEAERRRIAQNLHDSLGQNIGYLRLKLDQLSGEDALWEISLVKQELERMRDIAEDAYRQVRGTLADLHPSNSEDFMTTLSNNARSIGERAGFQTNIEVTGEPQTLPPHIKRQVLFICREALNNVEKHAKASNVCIKVSWTDESLDIQLKDDGSGFDLNRAHQNGHYGLSIIQERAEDIQGKAMIISSEMKGGTELNLWIPLKTEQVTA